MRTFVSINSLRRCSLAGVLLLASACFASAQTPSDGMPATLSGKRIALLIGQSDYSSAPMRSAWNDVSMLSSQFTAAGFETETAGDLTEFGVVERVKNLVERMTLSGNDTTVLVYISGRFAQIKGENILLPVGVPLDRESDVALNGFNVRKLLAALESVPSKARIVILDSAPAPNSLTKEKGFSPGLAIMDPPPGFVVAYSQGPNRQLLEVTEDTSVFSRALLEGIIQPNANIAELLKNVRLRVYAESNGQQLPWEAGNLKGEQFSFYSPEGNARPANIVASISMISDVKALPKDDAYKAVVASDSIQAYQAYIEAYPEDEAVPAMQYNLAVRREAEVWVRATRMNTPEAYYTYMSAYPDGGNVYVARERLGMLGYPLAPPSGFSPLHYSDLPPPLVGREIIASSMSMPLELAPRAPRFQMPPAPVMVATAAAAAVAAVAAAPLLRGPGGARAIPNAPAAGIRPTWASPVPSTRGIAPASAVGAPPPGMPRPVGQPAPIGTSTAAPAPAAGVVRPLGGSPTAPAASSAGASAPAGAGVRQIAPITQPVAGAGAPSGVRPITGNTPQAGAAAGAGAPRAIQGSQANPRGQRAASGQRAANSAARAAPAMRVPAVQQARPVVRCVPQPKRRC